MASSDVAGTPSGDLPQVASLTGAQLLGVVPSGRIALGDGRPADRIAVVNHGRPCTSGGSPSPPCPPSTAPGEITPGTIETPPAPPAG